MRYGLIGEKLGHSYSKIIHEQLADYSYDLIPLSKDEFHTFMTRKGFTAINVTIPYKQEVIPYLDQLHPHALEIGAVNTIVNKNGYLTGYNTDFYGFQYLLKHNDIPIHNMKCLVLGNGGTSKTVKAALKDLGAKEVLVVSRTASSTTITYEECRKIHRDADIIVNTTPLGMYPHTNASPLDLTPFQKCIAVVDVIYNPLETTLIKQAQELGIKAVNGLEMLVAQAKQAVEYFLDKKIEDTVIDDIYQKLLDQIKNAKTE